MGEIAVNRTSKHGGFGAQRHERQKLPIETPQTARSNSFDFQSCIGRISSKGRFAANEILNH
jgi:hypothetical protein